jgi:hypothetical protein
MHDLLARQVIGQWPAGRLAGVAEQNRRIRDCTGAFSLVQVLQTKLKLFDLTIQLLRRPAELHAPQTRQLR